MTLLVLALVSCFIAFACWFGVQLLRQNGRMLERLESLERQVEHLVLASEAGSGGHGDSAEGGRQLAKSRLKRDGLAPGAAAPDFRVPRLDGGELSLAEFRGRSLLLVFSDPHCGPCDALAPRLEQRGRSGRVPVVMISRGDVDANRAKVAQHGLTFPIGLQRHWEISKMYAMFATPIAYLIDADGNVAAPVAKGPEAILGLWSRAASVSGDGPALAASPASSWG